jgi:hypothetical protein
MENPQTNYAKPIKKERKKEIKNRDFVIYVKIKDILINNTKYSVKVNNIYHLKLYADNDFNLNPGWYRIQVSYKRSGVFFFSFLDVENFEEYTSFEDSIFTEDLIPEKVKFKDLEINDDVVDNLQIESYNDPFDIKFILNSGKELIYKKNSLK